jgi:hypothetical protein
MRLLRSDRFQAKSAPGVSADMPRGRDADCSDILHEYFLCCQFGKLSCRAVNLKDRQIPTYAYSRNQVRDAFKISRISELKRRYVLPFFLKLPLCLIGIEVCAEMGVILGPAPRDCTPVYATRS